MLSRTVIVLLVAVLSISWGARIRLRHPKLNLGAHGHGPVNPILDINHEYMRPEDHMKSLPASYENLVYKLLHYKVCPKDKYIKVLSRTSFTFERTTDFNESDVYYFVKSFIEIPMMRRRFILIVIQMALERLVESSEELEKTITPLIINDVSKPLENATELNATTTTRLNTEEGQEQLKVMRLQVNSTKLMLQDLEKSANSYTEYDREDITDFTKNIGGLSLQELLNNTASLLASVRRSWFDLRMMSHYSDVTKA